MKTRVVETLTPFQTFIWRIVQELRYRGYNGNSEVEIDAITKMASHYPPVRELRDTLGWQWQWPEAEKQRVVDVVQYNLRFFDQPMYAYPGCFDILKTEYTDTTVTTGLDPTDEV